MGKNFKKIVSILMMVLMLCTVPQVKIYADEPVEPEQQEITEEPEKEESPAEQIENDEEITEDIPENTELPSESTETEQPAESMENENTDSEEVLPKLSLMRAPVMLGASNDDENIEVTVDVNKAQVNGPYTIIISAKQLTAEGRDWDADSVLHFEFTNVVNPPALSSITKSSDAAVISYNSSGNTLNVTGYDYKSNIGQALSISFSADLNTNSDTVQECSGECNLAISDDFDTYIHQDGYDYHYARTNPITVPVNGVGQIGPTPVWNGKSVSWTAIPYASYEVSYYGAKSGRVTETIEPVTGDTVTLNLSDYINTNKGDTYVVQVWAKIGDLINQTPGVARKTFYNLNIALTLDDEISSDGGTISVVTSSGETFNPDSSDTISGIVGAGDEVTVTATPNDGYNFVSYNSYYDSAQRSYVNKTDNPFIFTIDTNQNISAKFVTAKTDVQISFDLQKELGSDQTTALKTVLERYFTNVSINAATNGNSVATMTLSANPSITVESVANYLTFALYMSGVGSEGLWAVGLQSSYNDQSAYEADMNSRGQIAITSDGSVKKFYAIWEIITDVELTLDLQTVLNEDEKTILTNTLGFIGCKDVSFEDNVATMKTNVSSNITVEEVANALYQVVDYSLGSESRNLWHVGLNTSYSSESDYESDMNTYGRMSITDSSSPKTFYAIWNANDVQITFNLQKALTGDQPGSLKSELEEAKFKNVNITTATDGNSVVTMYMIADNTVKVGRIATLIENAIIFSNIEDSNKFVVGLQSSSYASESAYKEDMDKSLSDTDKIFYLVEFAPINKIEYTIGIPTCGTTVTLDDSYQSPRPAITIAEDNHFSIYTASEAPFAGLEFNFWMYDNDFLSGDILCGNTYGVVVYLVPDFGYYFLEDATVDITNGEYDNNKSDIYYSGSIVYANVAVPNALEFKGFSSENNKNVYADYNCGNPKHIEHVDCTDSIVKTEEQDNKHVVYTANVSADKSIDGQAHSGNVLIPKAFNLYVGGVRVTGENCDDVLGNGTVIYNPATNTLTLNNANIEISKRIEGEDQYEYGIRCNINSAENLLGSVAVDSLFTINLVGNNNLTDNSDDNKAAKYGMLLFDNGGGYNFSGDGTLNIRMNANSNKVYKGIEVHKEVAIDGASININIPGSAKTSGYEIVGANVTRMTNEAKLNIITGNNSETYSLVSNVDTPVLDMAVDTLLVATSYNFAVNSKFTITDATKILGAYVKNKADSSTIIIWDPSYPLSNYEYVSIPMLSDYSCISGSGTTWTKGSKTTADFVFKNESDDENTYRLFKGILVDGDIVAKTNYTDEEGSVKIYLKPEYLETLSVGEHTLIAYFRDGYASAKFTIVKKSNPSPNYNPPKTGIEKTTSTINHHYKVLVGASMIFGATLVEKRRKSKQLNKR